MTSTGATLRLGEDVLAQRHAAALRAILDGDVRFGLHDRMLYATDASIYQVRPLGVVIPAHTEDAARALAYCVREGLAVLARGGGTSLAGQCTNRAVVMDMSSSCCGVLEIGGSGEEGGGRCRVEPGITIDDLNDRLRAMGTGLFFAPDPATARQANVGGCIGNNAAGTRSILYGRMAENLLGVDVLLAERSPEPLRLDRGAAMRDERARELTQRVIDVVQRHEALIRGRYPKTLRRNAGYALDMVLSQIDEARSGRMSALQTLNLAHLLCGSEGTLAVTVGAELKLHPVPRARGLSVLGFASLDDAIGVVPELLGTGPSAVELLDDLIIGLAEVNREYREYVGLMPRPGDSPLHAVLYVEHFCFGGRGEVEDRFESVREVIARSGVRAGCAFYPDGPEMMRALKLRKAGEPLLHAIPGDRKPIGFVEDNAVPVERLAEFVRRFREIVSREGTIASFYAHASVGVLHVRPLLSLRDPEDRARMERIAVDVAELARELGGVMSGEHGDGRVRGPLLERFYGPELMRAFREIKSIFDPAGLLNPGNIVTPLGIESIHERTRVRPEGEDVRPLVESTYFAYPEAGGLDHAVELCNGAGVCRKKQGGTMCPSYMATLDERHSTRGRGNALRLAITGQLGATEDSVWNDAETMETLRLCLSCKACKTECPSNVDVAKYKAEYLAQSYRARGWAPLSAWVFAHVRWLNRLGSVFAPISGAVAGSTMMRTVTDRLLGLAPERSLPPFERSLFRAMRRARRGLERSLPPDAPRIILYADCFTAFNEPGIGMDAARLLAACGYRVIVPRLGCCGRAAISTGLLGRATEMAGETARAILAARERHRAVAVVVCEPSCLSAIKDEWRVMRTGIDGDALDRLAGDSWLVEDFVDSRWDEHPKRPEFRAAPGRIVLHGHCHQKALWGAESSAGLLRRITGGRPVEVLDSGCCGMAGSFGFTRDRYDLSMAIGELAVLPAARSLGPDDVLAAPGTSCRHQVLDGAGRHALHPVSIAASRLTANGEGA